MSVAAPSTVIGIDRDKLLSMYERMVQIRTFEDAAGKNFADGLVPGFVHLYAGEEAVAVGVCAHLTDRDYITSTHRGHGHCIAKGVDIPGMVAELMGKATGVCKGKGGSMHIADVDKGMLGANGIVGGGLPLACGAALTAKTLGTGGVAVCFFGDGASNQGTFHEALNLAAIWKLPVVFVCENNGYAESTPVSLPLLRHRHRQPRRRLRDPRRRRRRTRSLRRLRSGRRGDRPRPPRRRPDPARGQDLSLLRPLPGRHGHLPHRRRAQPLQASATRSRASAHYAIDHDLATADELDAIDARVASRRSTTPGTTPRPPPGPSPKRR